MIDEVEQRIREQMQDNDFYNTRSQEILREYDSELYDQLLRDAWEGKDCSREEAVMIHLGELCKEAVLELSHAGLLA